MLELKHISKIYNPGLVTEMCLFDDFNITVKDGEFVSVIGSNGSLTGYAGGIARKTALLTLEQADLTGTFVPRKGTAL